MGDDIFNSLRVARAFARAERVLGAVPFTLDDGRTLKGVASRIHSGETILPNNEIIKADVIIVATRAQFTPAGGVEMLPASLDDVSYAGRTWRAEFVTEDEVHITLYLAKNP